MRRHVVENLEDRSEVLFSLEQAAWIIILDEVANEWLIEEAGICETDEYLVYEQISSAPPTS